MQSDEPEPSPEQLWKSQEEEKMTLTLEQVRDRARRRARNDTRVYWGLVIIAPFVVAAYIHNLMRFHNPWLIAGSAWALAVFGYFVWVSVRQGPPRQTQTEPCLLFARRLLEGRRLWARRMRVVVWLCVPAILSIWWGRRPAVNPAPFLLLVVMLALLWLGMTLEVRRCGREIEKLSSAG